MSLLWKIVVWSVAAVLCVVPLACSRGDGSPRVGSEWVVVDEQGGKSPATYEAPDGQQSLTWVKPGTGVSWLGGGDKSGVLAKFDRVRVIAGAGEGATLYIRRYHLQPAP
jgi:hypothetical protein